MQRRFPAHPSNADGPFYVVNNECIACGAPEFEAPDLMSHDEDRSHCFFSRQPSTPEEINTAIRAVWTSCCQALRYAGDDPAIRTRLAAIGMSQACDVPLKEALAPMIRDCVTFKYTTAETADKSDLHQIIRFIADRWTGNCGWCSDFRYGATEGSFVSYWGLKDEPNSIRFRIEQRPEAKWLIRLEDNDVAKIGTSIFLDKALQASPGFREIRWFTADDLSKNNAHGWAHPY